MKQVTLAIAVSLLPATAIAQDSMVANIIDHHILPRFERLAAETDILAAVAATTCDTTSVPLRAAYGDAFDAWVSASHLRFGPTEVDDRAFALAFWPDSRGATPKALNRLIADQDPIVGDSEDYSDMSIAARGFYAMEFVLYDPALSTSGNDEYRCALLRAIATDTSAVAQDIHDDWVNDYAARLTRLSATGTYRSTGEVLQELLKALSTGLEFTTETRLGRPLGTYDQPRPARAEAWRSERSERHVTRSLEALRELAADLAAGNAELAADLDTAFDRALDRLARLDDPAFAGVADPISRLNVELIQQSAESIRTLVRERLGPELGVVVGFNSLDGD